MEWGGGGGDSGWMMGRKEDGVLRLEPVMKKMTERFSFFWIMINIFGRWGGGGESSNKNSRIKHPIMSILIADGFSSVSNKYNVRNTVRDL